MVTPNDKYAAASTQLPAALTGSGNLKVSIEEGAAALVGVPTADSTANSKVSDVAGNKGDSAVTTVANDKTLMAYIKGILNTVKEQLISQVPVDFTESNPVQNTWSEVTANLSGGKRVQLWYIIVAQTNNGGSAENLELEMVINGTTYTISLNAIASADTVYVYASQNKATGDFEFLWDSSVRTARSLDLDHSVPFVASSVGQIRVRQTSDVDVTSAKIDVNIVWDKQE